MPANAVNCARPGRWGNPFVVGTHGTRERCVELFEIICTGRLCISVDEVCVTAQKRFLEYTKDHIADLRGKDLACWCRIDGNPCHADVLLKIANKRKETKE